MSMVLIENLTHANGGKKLYKETLIRLNKGEHIALIGPNGCGKTTLLNIIAGKVIPDEGIIDIHPKTKIGYLDQHQDVNKDETVEQYLKETFKELFDLETRMNAIYEAIGINYDEDELTKALKYQDILIANDFDTIEKKIGNLVNGLGIGLDKLSMNMGELSGGQRGKVMLAKLLLSGNDFLLLDEPTNFLDLQQVEWLAKFLQNFEKPFLMVSHDNDFIDKTCNIIYAINNFELKRYVGNYQKYLSELEIQNEQHDRDFLGQQKQIDKLKTYIAKNAARASTAKSAQSRVKQLEKIDVLDRRQEVDKPNFSFKYKRPSTSVAIKAEELEIGYDSPLLHPMTFEIREGEKCIITGKNGIGKTTFLKTICTELNPVSGKLQLGTNVSYAYFRQLEENSDKTPVEYLKNIFEDMPEGDIRAKLAQFGIKRGLMNQPMNLMSGGEQSKVRLSALSINPVSLLILDEPTNHIDVYAKDSLLEAIQKFEGTVILTTHDINFSTKWADKVLDFEELK